MRGKKVCSRLIFLFCIQKKIKLENRLSSDTKFLNALFLKEETSFSPLTSAIMIYVRKDRREKRQKNDDYGNLFGLFFFARLDNSIGKSEISFIFYNTHSQRKLLIILSKKPIGKPWLCKQRAQIDFLYNVEKNLIRFQNLL